MGQIVILKRLFIKDQRNSKHMFFNITRETFQLRNNIFRSWTQKLLGVHRLNVESCHGFKVKSFLKLRCSYCYFIRVNGRMHVECKASPRHKSREPFNTKLLW